MNLSDGTHGAVTALRRISAIRSVPASSRSRRVAHVELDRASVTARRHDQSRRLPGPRSRRHASGVVSPGHAVGSEGSARARRWRPRQAWPLFRSRKSVAVVRRRHGRAGCVTTPASGAGDVLSGRGPALLLFLLRPAARRERFARSYVAKATPCAAFVMIAATACGCDT